MGPPAAAYAEMFDLLDDGLPPAARRPRRAAMSALPRGARRRPRRHRDDTGQRRRHRHRLPVGHARRAAVRQDARRPAPGHVRAGGGRAAGPAGDRRHRRARGRARGPARAGARVDRTGAAGGRAPRRTSADALAAVHRTTGPWFGGLDPDLGGFIGSQPVDLTPTDDWATFYVERRVRPLTARAVDAGRLDPARDGARRSRRAHAAASCAVRPSRRPCCTATCGAATGWSTAPAPTG